MCKRNVKAEQVLEKYNLDVNISYEEFNKKYPNCHKTHSFSKNYPRVCLDINDNERLWIDFEYDLSKIRYIEKSDEFKIRYHVYQRHGFWSFIR